MKVVHILNELKFSGAEIMYVDAAEKLKSLGCMLYVINSSMNLGEYAEEATIIEETATSNKSLHFIEANTQEVSLNHLK